MSASVRDRLQRTLGGAYTLQRELAGGGMSRVFVARDIALEREVVVKVLSPELAVGVSAERFAREIRLAAGLQQANIVPLLSAGETDGLPYYTMPFVDGLSLRDRLDRAGALPVGEAVSVVRDVARALAYAHDHGVVHRDVKPENILLSGDAAVVTDFGIARALAASRTRAPDGAVGERLTQQGTSIGTPAYMAPEQAAGDPATDHRADLYALGCVAYEMLTGAPPFAGRPVHQLYAAHLLETPAPIARARPDVPRGLAALVARCLAKDPADRPQSARAVLDALDGDGVAAGGVLRRWPGRLTVAGLALVATAVGGWALRSRTETDAPRGERTIAVLPFQTLGDSADAYFADGITDAVRGKLTGLPGVTVIARVSSMSYRGSAKPPQVIARELGVRYLLTGTVRFAGGGGDRRVQVSPELVEVSGGRAPTSRWQQPFDAALKDVFGVQADIATRVAGAMQVALGGAAQARLAATPTRDPAAYDAFLQGESYRQTGAVDPRMIRHAIAAYEEAVRHDGGMALAWARLSSSRSLLYANTTPAPAMGRAALAAAERAVALDSAGESGHLALSAYHRFVTRDLDQALAAVGRARARAPHDVLVVGTAAELESDMGRLEAAERDFAELVRLDPRRTAGWSSLSLLLIRLGRIAEARVAADRALALVPTSHTLIAQRAMVEAAAGDVAAARAVIARGLADVPREGLVTNLAVYWDMGWLLDAEQERLLLTLGPDAFDDDRGAWALVRAQQHGWRGDAAPARAWGDSAARELAAQLAESPDDAQRHVVRGLALAYAGRGAEALAEAARGLALEGQTPAGRATLEYGYFAYVAARAALLAGDRVRALGWLAESRRARYYATPGWLRAEPTWASLRGDPRFAALATDPAPAR